MIEVNEYVRTDKGYIFKIDKEEKNLQIVKFFDAEYGKIVKHSKIISEVVNVGDYVNGKLIHKIDKGTNYCYLYYGNCKTFVNYQIKSIVTHEQFSSIEYKVEEEK